VGAKTAICVCTLPIILDSLFLSPPLNLEIIEEPSVSEEPPVIEEPIIIEEPPII